MTAPGLELKPPVMKATETFLQLAQQLQYTAEKQRGSGQIGG
jgi:hypothetical protein